MNLFRLRKTKFHNTPRKVFAVQLGISESYLCLIELKKRRPAEKLIKRLSQVYGESQFLIRSLLAKVNAK